MLSEKFFECLDKDGIVAIATANEEGQAHLVNTWNKCIIVTEDEKILIPCAGFHKTEKNVTNNPYVEMSIGSPEVMGRNYMGAGFHLTGTAEFYSDGLLFERMHQERSFCSRVMVFTPETCRQMV